MPAEEAHFACVYSAAELKTFRSERVHKMPLTRLDPSMLIGFVCRDEADWVDSRRRGAEACISLAFFSASSPFPTQRGGRYRGGPVAPITPLPGARFDLSGGSPPAAPAGKDASAPAVSPEEDDFVDARGGIEIEADWVDPIALPTAAVMWTVWGWCSWGG
jgi:hypothetical protein